MIYLARTENREMFIAMYETEEPKPTPCKPKHHGYCEDFCQGKCQENDAEIYAEWQSSKREYKVRDEDKEKVKELLTYEIIFSKKYDNLTPKQAFEKGIDCTFLKDRLELEEVEGYVFTNNGRDGVKEIDTVWTLLPLEDKKENEAVELKDRQHNEWNEVFDIYAQIKTKNKSELQVWTELSNEFVLVRRKPNI